MICARDGDDTVYGGGGADLIKGGSGDDTLKGQAGGDRVIGGGSDKMFGGYGDDKINSRDGKAGNDVLYGGPHVSHDTKLADATEKFIVGFP